MRHAVELWYSVMLIYDADALCPKDGDGVIVDDTSVLHLPPAKPDCICTCAAKAELKRVQAAAEQHAAVMAAELAAARAAETAARADATKVRSAHASCSCQLAEAQQELVQV